jgi:peptidoglycan/LPS O-acetylase OafA/YrhL
MDAVDTRLRFQSLEGLRGVLALLVCAGHLGLNTIANRADLTVHFALAVDVFFALSGFVLCYSNYFGRKPFNAFVIGRFARLYPLHLLTMVAMAMMWPALGEMWPALGSPFTTSEFLQSLATIHNIGLPPNRLPLNFPSWSVSVEIWVSLMFFFILQHRPNRMVILLLMAVVPAILVPGYITGDAANALGVLNLGLLRGIAGFSVGAMSYLIFEKFGQQIAMPSAVLYALLAALAAFFFIGQWPIGLPILFYGVLGMCLIGLAAMDEATVLSARPVVFLGKISYSIYLLHIPILSAVALAVGDKLTRGIVGKSLVLMIIIAASAASYRWLERRPQQFILSIGRALPQPLP